MSGGYETAWERLCVAAETVPGVTVQRKPGASVGPLPVVYVPPPSLTWEAFSGDPTEGVIEVILAVRSDERAIANLFRYLRPVYTALDGAEDSTVLSAEPTLWRAGSVDLPAYTIRVEVAV